MPRFATALAIFAATSSSLAQPGDTSAIQWHVPGSFEAARAEAQRENRILLIKGISFGVDDEGAACATKGTW